MGEEEQFDEILEELWVLEEHAEIAEIGRMEVDGAHPPDAGRREDARDRTGHGLTHPPDGAHGTRHSSIRATMPYVRRVNCLRMGAFVVDVHRRRAAGERQTSSVGTGWRSACLPRAWECRTRLKLSSKPASSNTSVARSDGKDLHVPGTSEDCPHGAPSRRGLAALERKSSFGSWWEDESLALSIGSVFRYRSRPRGESPLPGQALSIIRSESLFTAGEILTRLSA